MAANFKYCPEQYRALHHLSTVERAVLLFGPYNMTEPMILDVSWEGKILWNEWAISMGKS